MVINDFLIIISILNEIIESIENILGVIRGFKLVCWFSIVFEFV